MTAQSLIDESRYQLNDSGKAFYTDAELLAYLNAGVRFLASELKLWNKTEELQLIDSKSVYALSGQVIQIANAYDTLGRRRPFMEQSYQHNTFIDQPYRSESLYSVDPLSIYQISPTQIQFVDATNGMDLVDAMFVNINYYYCPNEYALVDTLNLNPSQIHLLTFYIAYRASLKVRGATDQFAVENKRTMQAMWQQELANYKMQNPTSYIKDEIVDRISERNFI